MSTTANDLVQEVREEFLRKNADLLALTRDGVNVVMKRVSASMALDEESRDELMAQADEPFLNQKGYAGRVARDGFKAAMYSQICKHFCAVQHRLKIEFVSKLTVEALAQLEAIEVSAGVRQPAPPPPPVKSAQEQLEDQIRYDWLNLPSDKMKAKLNDPAYRAAFDRLMAADALATHCTTLTNGSQGGFQR
jgi:hypothetical protein